MHGQASKREPHAGEPQQQKPTKELSHLLAHTQNCCTEEKQSTEPSPATRQGSHEVVVVTCTEEHEDEGTSERCPAELPVATARDDTPPWSFLAGPLL